MKSIFLKLNQMHNKFGIELNEKNKEETLEFRKSLLNEEVKELEEANNAEDKVDALIDIIVIAAGTLDLFNVDGDKAFDAVHKANLNKRVGTKKGRANPVGIDLTKPKGWISPSHKGNHGKF